MLPLPLIVRARHIDGDDHEAPTEAHDQPLPRTFATPPPSSDVAPRHRASQRLVVQERHVLDRAHAVGGQVHDRAGPRPPEAVDHVVRARREGVRVAHDAELVDLMYQLLERDRRQEGGRSVVPRGARRVEAREDDAGPAKVGELVGGLGAGCVGHARQGGVDGDYADLDLSVLGARGRGVEAPPVRPDRLAGRDVHSYYWCAQASK
mmetsp:Transcript_38155/g.91339  ORF Transcript_38155/g.91339 Transcript_38155/m.91339 type:complete len:207 (-) Transcript_38155:276-896(-)